MPARLVTEFGPTSAADFALPEGEMIGLGRNPACGLVLLDRHVSRWHATVSGRNGRYFLRDNNSVNGTRLDARAVLCETPLSDGQVIRAGAVALRFRHAADAAGVGGPVPVRIDPEWLSANDRAAKNLALSMLKDEDYSLLPLLADALEDAGCTDADVLDHCRREAHRGACWLLDLLVPPETRKPPDGGDSTLHRLLPWDSDAGG